MSFLNRNTAERARLGCLQVLSRAHGVVAWVIKPGALGRVERTVRFLWVDAQRSLGDA